MTPRNQVVQAQCPKCKTALRIPTSWVGQMMRCKHCKQEFQARAPKSKDAKPRKSILAMALQMGRIKKKRKRKLRSKGKVVLQSKPAVPPPAIPMGAPLPPTGMPPVPGAKAPPVAIPMGKPVVPAAIPVGGLPAGMPPPPPNAFANINDGTQRRRRGGGKQKLAFLFIFLLAIGGLATVVYNATQQEKQAVAVATPTDPFAPAGVTQPTTSRPAPPTIGGPKLPSIPQPPTIVNIPPPPTRPKEPAPRPPVVGNNPIPNPNPNPNRPPMNRPPVPPGTQPTRPNVPMVPQPPPATAYDNMPRRMFAIIPTNYYYANPVSVGSGNLAVTSILYQFADMMKIPARNVVVVSDRPPAGQKAVPPIKPVIELNLTTFLDSCRPYDRIIVFAMGHGVEIEGVPYFMPLEGEKDNPENLIPLDWIFMKLAQCSARQKVLILDVCRYDPTRGEERGKVDPMGLAFDAMLQNPPPGVQVLTACTAGQYSLEIESNSQEFGATTGGLMLSRLVEPTFRNRYAGTTANPEDPFPIESMATGLVPRTNNFARFLKLGTEQTPRLTGSTLETGLALEASIQPAPRIEVELAGDFKDGVASTEAVRSIFDQVAGIPSVKRDSNEVSGQLDFNTLPPFSSKAIEAYKDDGKVTPFRNLIMEAVNALKNEKAVTNLRFTAPAATQQAENAFKAQIENIQKQVSITQYELSILLDDLKALSAERDKETKRWQANYEYVCARLEARIAYLYEYNAQLGNIRREFPARDPAQHIGWQLASRERISDRDASKNHKNMLRHLEKLASEHGGTPWSMVAKRERATSLGLDWVPLPR